MAGKKTQIKSDFLKRYAVMRAQTSDGNHYIGRIKLSRFIGGKLEIILLRMIKIKLRGEPPAWVTETRYANYKFNFDDCITIENNGTDRIKLTTPKKDVVVLSDLKEDMEEFRRLIS